MDIFIPKPDNPNHIRIPDHIEIITGDFNQDEFRWARLVRNNFIEQRGFLVGTGEHRITTYMQVSYGDGVYRELGQDQFKPLTEQLHPEKSSIIWYRPGTCIIDVIITNVENSTWDKLPQQYKRHYHT